MSRRSPPTRGGVTSAARKRSSCTKTGLARVSVRLTAPDGRARIVFAGAVEGEDPLCPLVPGSTLLCEAWVCFTRPRHQRCRRNSCSWQRRGRRPWARVH